MLLICILQVEQTIREEEKLDLRYFFFSVWKNAVTLLATRFFLLCLAWHTSFEEEKNI